MEPWSLKKTNTQRMNTVLFIAIDQIAKITILLNPIIPIATSKVLNAMNLPKSLWSLSFIKDNRIFHEDITIKSLDILFKKFN